MKKKLVSIILTLAMVLTMLPLSALAASWTVNLNGASVKLTEDGSGGITSDPDQSQYYTFKKLADQDAFDYYTLQGVYVGKLTGTPVTVEEDECTCSAKCDPAEPDTGCPVCAEDPSACEGAEVNTAGGTVEDIPLESETATEVTIDNSAADEKAAELAAGAADANDGVVELSLSEAAGEALDANKTVNVPLSGTLLNAVKEQVGANAVQVNLTAAVSVKVPVAAFETITDVTLNVKTTAKGIDLKLDGNSAEFKAPITVNVTVNVTGIENPVMSFLKSAGQYVRVRQDPAAGGAFSFRTRHFSEFEVVAAALTEADTMEDIGENGYHAYEVEQDETVVAAIQNSDGTLNYLRMNATAGEPGDELRTTPEFDFNDDLIFNVVAVIGAADKNAQGAIELSDPTTAIRIDSNFVNDIL